MDALAVETSIAAGAPALQTLLKCGRERAGTREAHDAEQGLFTRRWPMGLAAMQLDFAPRGTGDLGAAVTRADGLLLRRETPLRAQDSGSLFGQFAGPRTCDRTPGEPGICPRDAQVHFPARCDASGLQAWMTVCAGAPPVQDRAGLCEPLFALEGAESVLMAVAPAAPPDDESF